MKPVVQRRLVSVIGEHKASGHPFYLTLKSHPLLSTAVANQLQRLEIGRADIVVYFYPDEYDSIHFINELPVLFIVNDPQSLPLGVGDSLWREVISSNASMEEFNQKLGRLLELVSLQKQRNELMRREHLHERYLADVNLASAPDVISRLIQLVAENTRAKNVLWISSALAQSWWAQANRRRSMPSLRTLEEMSQCVWWRPEEGNLEELMQKSWPLAMVGRDWASGEMVRDEDSQCGVMRLVSEYSELDLGYLIFDQPARLLRSGRRIFKRLERYLAYALMYEENRRLIYVDDLTQLYNQRYLPMVLNSEIARAAREERKISILFLDVDYFKSVNDTRGHLVGSKLLIELSKLIRNSIRGYDYAFRYGGDEFVVVLPNTDTVQGQLVAERIRSRIEESEFLVYQKHYKVTVSVGVATYPDHAANAEQVLQLADEAMYNAKKASRNVVYIAS